MDANKIIALLNEKFRGCEIDDIQINDNNEIDVDGEVYVVYTDDEADEAFEEYQRGILDDLGIDAFTESARQYILNNYVDVEWFEDAMRESYESYVEDIKHEKNRLQEELEEHGFETEEEYVDYLCDQYEDASEWYRDNFGKEAFASIVKSHNLLDEDKVIEYVKEEDGRICLASYDGEELELDDEYIAYRIG